MGAPCSFSICWLLGGESYAGVINSLCIYIWTRLSVKYIIMNAESFAKLMNVYSGVLWINYIVVAQNKVLWELLHIKCTYVRTIAISPGALVHSCATCASYAVTTCHAMIPDMHCHCLVFSAVTQCSQSVNTYEVWGQQWWRGWWRTESYSVTRVNRPICQAPV